MKKHMDKYHTVKNMNIEEIVILPEVTEQRKNNLHEIVIEHGRIANVEELLQESEEEYDPKDGGNIKKNGQSAASGNPLFLFKGSLRSHMNLSNTGSFNCHICKYAFKEKTKLTKHQTTTFSDRGKHKRWRRSCYRNVSFIRAVARVRRRI